MFLLAMLGRVLLATCTLSPPEESKGLFQLQRLRDWRESHERRSPTGAGATRTFLSRLGVGVTHFSPCPMSAGGWTGGKEERVSPTRFWSGKRYGVSMKKT